MAIPNASKAFVQKSKIADYLLNLAHPVGASKARWFKSLGYTEENVEHLILDFLSIVKESDEYLETITSFGVKYTVGGRLNTPSGRVVNIKTVWIVDAGQDNPRLITAFPGDK